VPRLSPGGRCALTAPFHPYPPVSRRSGGLFSVALSCESPRLAVNQHPALGSSDFPPVGASRPPPAIASVSLAIILLGPALPLGSSNQPGVIVRATRPLSGLASGGVCRALAVTSEAVRSYRTVSPLPALRQAVCFLWHFPASHLDWPLTSTLPCEARTFLPRRTRCRAAASGHLSLSEFCLVATILLGPPLPTGSSDQPGVIVRATRPLSGLASGGVCRASSVTGRAVRSYRTVSPLPSREGGLFSVALSCESPRLAVSQHPAL
jgi:hypothetical protein